MKREAALQMAERALTFLSERPADLQRFLTASGLDAAEMLERHADESILAAVIGFVAGDESLAKDFSTDEKLKPGQLLTACAVIDPHGSSAW
jgi:allophanate hydrolase subunit 1